MKKDIAVWGWWQGQNLGDQWIKKVMNKIFPDADFVDTSFKNFRKYKFIVCGGGGLFVDDVPRVWRRAKNFTRYGMIGLGAEFRHLNNTAMAVAKNADFFYIRDKYSAECMHLKNLPKSYDITFYNPLPIKDLSQKNDNCLFIWRKPDQWMLQHKEFIEYQSANYDYYEWEKTVYSSFRHVINDDFVTYSDNAFERIKSCDYVISGRFHGIIAAIQLGIPCIAIDVCPKTRSLMQELGLEEFCLKYNEVSILPEKIKKLKEKYNELRNIELAYRKQAASTIKNQVNNAKFQIYKILNPLKIMHIGYYYFGYNDVVKVMADALKKSCKVIEIHLRNFKITDPRIKAVIPTKNGMVSVLRTEILLFYILLYRPHAIILNSGGITPGYYGYWILKKTGIKLVGIELSDPDVFPYNGQLYSDKFDLYYTNALYSVDNQYKKIGVKAGLLGFAATPDHHYPIPDIEKKFDIVIVGGCRPDRIPVVEELKKKYKVGLYGSGWKDSMGFVSGTKQVEAINSGKIYLSFSKTMAGFNNVKVGLFEAVACHSFVLTEYMEELNQYFEIGREIICFNSIQELLEKADYYLSNDNERNIVSERSYQRYLNEHTYEQRWNKVVRDLYTILDGEKENE